jgi:hypothetical protein
MVRPQYLPLAWLLFSPLIYAADINKCVDDRGNVTYTDASCGAAQTLEQRFERINPKPSGDDTVRMAPPASVPVAPPAVAPAPVVVAPAPVQTIPAPPPPEPAPNVIYVPISDGARYRDPYRRYGYDQPRDHYGYGNGRPNERPSRPPLKPRPPHPVDKGPKGSGIQSGSGGPSGPSMGRGRIYPEPRQP